MYTKILKTNNQIKFTIIVLKLILKMLLQKKNDVLFRHNFTESIDLIAEKLETYSTKLIPLVMLGELIEKCGDRIAQCDLSTLRKAFLSNVCQFVYLFVYSFVCLYVYLFGWLVGWLILRSRIKLI